MTTTELKTIQRVNSGTVIVYDLSVQTITTQKAKKFRGMDLDRFVLSCAHHKQWIER